MLKAAALVQELLNVQDDPEKYLEKLALDLMTPEQIAARMESAAVDPHLVDFGMKSKAVQGAKDVGRGAMRYLKYAPAVAGALPLVGALLPSKPAPPPSLLQRVMAAAGRNPALAVGGLLAGGAGLGYLASKGSQQPQPAPMGVM